MMAWCRVRMWLAVAVVAVDMAAATPESCFAVSRVYRRQGFRDNVPPQPISGEHLKMCQGETTCCTDVMERMLSVESRQEFDNNLKSLLNPVAMTFAKKNVKLNEVFGKLLNFSRKRFDDMFSRTYGLLYQQNAIIFTKLYDDLERYFNTGELDLQVTMDDFFKRLYQRMFTVINAQYTFNTRYLRCVTRHMEKLQPFRDVPQKLTIQIKRSFVALRTFVQGLATGRDVVRNVLKVNPSITCVHELMRMTHCGTCAGHPRVPPCLPYCRDVIHLCLAHHQPLVEHWTKYVDVMVSVAERLENPFNIENVVRPVNFKISDAIMNFQEAGHEISNKVFEGCGSPRLGRSKRQASGELEQEFLEFNAGEREAENRRRDKELENIAVSKYVHEVKSKIKSARNFWTELPSEMCKASAGVAGGDCWTGTRVGKYEGKSGLNVTEPRHNSEMDEQIMRLKVITSKLEEAYKGRDVSWIDDESWLNNGGTPDTNVAGDDASPGYEGSGSGSGDGYHGAAGHYPPDDEDAYKPSRGGNKQEGNHDPYGAYEDDDDLYSFHGAGRGGDHSYSAYEGSGDGWNSNHVDGELEGSGDHAVPPPRETHPDVYESPPSKPHQPPTHRNNPKEDSGQPPSAAAKESMTLYRALTIYMLPAFIMFLGSMA